MPVSRLLVLGLSLIVVCAASKSKTPFPFILEEAHHAVAGRVIYDAHRGARVKAIPERSQSESEHGTEDEGDFLRVVKRLARDHKAVKTTVRFDISGMTRKPEASRLTAQRVHPSVSSDIAALLTGSPSHLDHAVHRRSTSNRFTSDHLTNDDRTSARETTADRTRSATHVVTRMGQSTARQFITSGSQVRSVAADAPLFQEEEGVHLNEDLFFNVMETDQFYIDDENYIAVANSTGFEDRDNVEFYVYLSKLDGEAVSNPLAFIVYIDKPEVKSDDYPAVPAIFAGVLVCIIVFLALFIPFVTRAKRRFKQGKPVFKLGSHPSMVELDKAEVLPRVETREPNWYGNNTMFSYEEEVQKERSEFTRGLKTLSKKNSEPPTLQLKKKVKASSSSSSSSATGSTQDDTKYETQRL